MLLATARAPRLDDDAYVTLLSLYQQKRPALAIAVLDALPGLTPRRARGGGRIHPRCCWSAATN